MPGASAVKFGSTISVPTGPSSSEGTRPRLVIDRRTNERKKFDTVVEATIDGNHACLIDLSARGARFVSTRPFSSGDRVLVDCCALHGETTAWVALPGPAVA